MKKLNARQKREAQKQKKIEMISRITPQAGSEEKKNVIEDIKDKKPFPQSKRKSSAKAAGLKSAFILSGNEVLMTSFGHGNEACIEKHIIGKEISTLNDTPAFDTVLCGSTYSIKGRTEGSVDDPIRNNEERASQRGDKLPKVPGMDMLGMKETLEKRFFGAVAPFNDNIHIQLIYNILDIEKILAPHINNTAYIVNNLMRTDTDNDDLIGYLALKNSFGVFNDPSGTDLSGKTLANVKKTKDYFDILMRSRQRAYLGDALYRTGGKKGTKETEADFKRYYYSLCLIGEARQMLFHGTDVSQTAIYTLSEEYDNTVSGGRADAVKARTEARKVLDEIYEKRIARLNKNFLDLAKKDLAVLFSVYGANTEEKKKELVEKYYDFIVRKGQKNLGFSLKKLREIIFATDEGKTVCASCEQSMRSKFNKNFDFVQAVYYQERPQLMDRIVSALRSARTDEEKDDIYHREAAELWGNIKTVIMKHLLPVMRPEVFKDLQEDPDVNNEMLDSAAVSNEADYFSKFIFLFTKFLNGKEINDLLTQLISKFESIGSFYDVLSERNLFREFTKGYEIFADSWKIAGELRVINSFSRMAEPEPDAKKVMFVEAAQILGFNGTEEALSDYLDLMLTKDKDEAAQLKKKFWGITLPGKGFRNFIANNVIESNQFKYLVRYSKPKAVKAISGNDQVLKLALNEIPDTQIQRYYCSCISSTPASPDTMRDELRRLIKNISFEDFADVDQRANAEQNADKLRKQNVIRLYLAVLYLVVKNLVYINSRYTLAFHCFERDFQLITGRKWNSGSDRKHYNDLTLRFIEEKRLNRRSREYLAENIANSSIWCITGYRNTIDHLNAVRSIDKYIDGLKKTDSYFALFHYIVQRYLIESCETAKNSELPETHITHEYFETVRKYGKYRKDFVKALNTPFGYNLARYKNLSVEGLFDKNRPGEDEND